MTIRVNILTISDRSARGKRLDLSGPALVEAVTALGWVVVSTQIIPDEFEQIATTLRAWSDDGTCDLILTTGGTGFAPRDLTPEATLSVVERHTPGLTEAMRAASLLKTPHAMLSRAVAGIRRNCLIINLPGSPKAAVENLQVVLPALPHAIEILSNAPSAEAGHQTGLS